MKKLSKAKFVLTSVIVGSLFCFAIAGCAPEAKSQSDASGEEEVASVWTADMDCGVCHEDKQATTEDASLTACTHATQAQATCITCHTDEAALSKAHAAATASGPMPTKLKDTTVDMATCQSAGCHDQSGDAFKALTANAAPLVDVEGTSVNPHDVLEKTEGHSDITCMDCHYEHKADPNADVLCSSCHHMGVYTCNTCH